MRLLVSICIPTYNGAKYLQESLDSVKQQIYDNIEVIISDDASKDNTLKIVNDFKKEVSFPVHIFHHKPSGIGANWNNCIKNANGAYIKFLFQDDLIDSHCIEEMIKVIETNNHVGLVTCKRNIIVDSNVDIDYLNNWLIYCENLQMNLSETSKEVNFLSRRYFKHNSFYGTPTNVIGEPTCVLFKKDIVDDIGYFNENFEQVLDYEFWYRVLRKYKIAIINKKLVSFRLHKNQTTQINSNKVINDYEAYEKILYKDYFWLLHIKLQKQLLLKFNSKYRWLYKKYMFFIRE